MNARLLQVAQDEPVLRPKIVSALNGRIGSDIFVPPYQGLVETEYLWPISRHWTEECFPAGSPDEVEESAGDFVPGQILQPRRLLLRVF